MTTWGNICRICSSPADYEVFAKIPNYLHGTSNEFLNWQKPINVLLEEITGLKISIDDGLPRFMCALCISYMKHAVTFREQAIANALGLKTVMAMHELPPSSSSEQHNSDKESLLITANDLVYSEERKTDTNLLYSSESRDKVHKQLLNNSGRQIPQGGTEITNEHIRYLNLLFDKDVNVNSRAKSRKNVVERYEAATGSDPFAEDFQTASSDDNDATEQKENYFSYREKNFEEDDIMDMDELKEAIRINIPETCKERKCRACFRRFMFEESYKEHMQTCIEYKFLTTIEEINRLLDIRRGKAISPHEFIRRMIFCLRKTCEWLKANCGEMLLPDLLQNGEGAKKRMESEEKSSTADGSSGGGKSEECTQKQSIFEKLTKNSDSKNKSNMTDFTFNSGVKNSDFLIKEVTGAQDTHRIDLFTTPKTLLSRTTTPISVENNILYEIERSQSRNKQDVVHKSTRPIQEDRITFLQKLQNATSTTIKTPIPKCETFLPASPMITVRKDLLPDPVPTPNKSNLIFSARCNLCSIVFATVAEFEEHNAVHHNAQQLQEQLQQRQEVREIDEREKIIALFEESSDD